MDQESSDGFGSRREPTDEFEFVEVRFRKNDSDHEAGDVITMPTAKAAILVRMGTVRYSDKRLAVRMAIRSLRQWFCDPLSAFSDWYNPPVYLNAKDGGLELISYRPKVAVWLRALGGWFNSQEKSFVRDVIIGVTSAVIAASILAVVGFN